MVPAGHLGQQTRQIVAMPLRMAAIVGLLAHRWRVHVWYSWPGGPWIGAGIAASGLRAYAYANDLRLADVARDIGARRLRLHPGPGPYPDSTA